MRVTLELEGDAKAVLALVGVVVATSANRHGEPAPGTLAEIPDEIRAACSALVDGGELPGTASTVIDFTGPDPQVIREGAAAASEAIDRVFSALR